MDLKLRGKTALVTGGSVGLGRAICRVLAAEGAAVAVNYRSHAAEAESLAEELTASSVRAVALGADVADEGEVAAMFQAAAERLGPLDVLVNNAAVCPTGPAKDFSAAQWNETVQVNLTGTFLCCREMIRLLTSSGRPGRIVNVSSAAAFLGSTSGHAPYDASKGGIVSLTVSLAREVSRQGIAVNAVAQGMMRTDMTAPGPGRQPGEIRRPHPAGPHRRPGRSGPRRGLSRLGGGLVHDRGHGGCERRHADAVALAKGTRTT